MHQTPRSSGEVVREFIGSGGTVCGFAPGAEKRGEIVYTEVPRAGKAQGMIASVVQPFLKARNRPEPAEGYKTACVFIDDAAHPSPEEQREIARRMQEEILVAVERLNHPILQFLRSTRKRVRRAMAEEYFGVHAARYGTRQTIMLAMGPCYPDSHRRYAPRTLVSLTLQEDANLLVMQRTDLYRRTFLEITDRNGEFLGQMRFYEDLPLEGAEEQSA